MSGLRNLLPGPGKSKKRKKNRRDRGERRELKKGIMEYWNNGIMGQRENKGKME
jgi:hypothetical protein